MILLCSYVHGHASMVGHGRNLEAVGEQMRKLTGLSARGDVDNGTACATDPLQCLLQQQHIIAMVASHCCVVQVWPVEGRLHDQRVSQVQSLQHLQQSNTTQ